MNVMLSMLCLLVGAQGLPQLSCISSTSNAKSLDELERAVYVIAREKDVAATVILNRLLRKVKARQRLDRMHNRHSLQEIALTELLSTVAQMPPAPNGGLRENLPPPSREKPPKLDGLSTNRFPPTVNHRLTPQFPGMTYSVDTKPQPIFVPAIRPPVFQPPPGVTIRVNPGGAALVYPDVTVTISPMMTVLEALRQADAKFRASLGIPESADDVINFVFSNYAGCYVISRFGEVGVSERQVWKIIVADGRGKVIYDSICLPDRNEVSVKPGTIIFLTFDLL